MDDGAGREYGPDFGLSDEQVRRYSRQLVMPAIGGKGQRALLDSSVLIVGAGGLGSPVALYLAAAGVGRIGIVDEDVVDVSNLQRQILHRTADIGAPKVDSAARALTRLNPDVKVDRLRMRVGPENVADLVKPYAVVVGAVDNLHARYLINDACIRQRKPLVEAGVFRMEGLATTIIPGKTPCYRCLFPVEPDPAPMLTPAEAGVLGPVAGLVGCIQATEVIKIIVGIPVTLAGRLLVVDAREMSFRTINVNRNPKCPVCAAPADE